MRHRMLHSAGAALRQVCATTIKLTATLVAVMFGLMITLRALGVPVPSTEQLIRDVEGFF
jgi:hypothetical protein